jgi:hypothetical protein
LSQPWHGDTVTIGRRSDRPDRQLAGGPFTESGYSAPACDAAWDIVTVEQQGVEVQQVTCINDVAGIGNIVFDKQNGTANISVYELQEPNGRMCFGTTVARPAQ